MITLTDAERNHFADWLEQESASSEVLAKQAESLGPSFHVVVKRLRMEAAATMMVAKRLRNTESLTIG